MKKYISFLLISVIACTEADRMDYGKEVLLMTGTDVTTLVSFPVEDYPSTYAITVSATGKVKEDVTVSIAVDNSLVDEYNLKYGTSYYALSEDVISLESSTVVIYEGEASSTVSDLSITSDESFVDGRTYVIPVTITNVQGGDMDVLETSRTIYLKIARTIEFMSLDISNYNMYSNYIFDDELAVELSNYTYEIKFYAYAWHTSTSEPISRLCCWTSKDESGSNMLRIGENGLEINQLQWTNPAGQLNSETLFSAQRWYTLSLTYDGSNLVMYVDGVKDSEMTGDGSTTFQRFELGMSWGDGYRPKQYFNGRIAEVRVWSRALSSGEIQTGLCAVDPESEGLVAYWKFDEGESYIFYDSTGNGYDMDWSDTWRDYDESGNLLNYDYSAYVEAAWVQDDNNKCSE